jgi:D-alanyl-lipoteichoic acid acyltransferase DltB (MBOAT superfamily)
MISGEHCVGSVNILGLMEAEVPSSKVSVSLESWHISLSSWFRDYFILWEKMFSEGIHLIYLQLLISGDGIDNTFICWGALHGLHYFGNHYLNLEKIIRGFSLEDSFVLNLSSLTIL